MPQNIKKVKKNRNDRADHRPGVRTEYEHNRKRILASQDVCGICGKPVDKSLKYPDPYSASVDHIIPVSKGGHPSAMDNLQLAHLKCNRLKWDKLQKDPLLKKTPVGEEIDPGDPRNLRWSIDWERYRATDTGSNALQLREEAAQLEAKGFVLAPQGPLSKAGK